MTLTLASDSRTVGTFIKTDSIQTVEILGLCGLDYAVLDAEHAPFDRGQVNVMLLAARAARLPMLVRVPDSTDATLLSILDMGAAGLLIPHVDTAEQARDIVSACRFIGGRRGFSLSPRFAGYGTMPRTDAIAKADQALIFCQAESAQAVDNAGKIAAVPGVAGLVVGRLDLSLSMGADSTDDPRIEEAVRKVVAAGKANAKPVIAAVGNIGEMEAVGTQGVMSFIVGSDQSLLRMAATQLAGAARQQP